jgi:hypothetical protein
VNTVVLIPIPRARVVTTAAENQGCERIILSAKRTSFLIRIGSFGPGAPRAAFASVLRT